MTSSMCTQPQVSHSLPLQICRGYNRTLRTVLSNFLVKILSEKPTQRKWKKDEEEESQLDADDILFESKSTTFCW